MDEKKSMRKGIKGISRESLKGKSKEELIDIMTDKKTKNNYMAKLIDEIPELKRSDATTAPNSSHLLHFRKTGIMKILEYIRKQK